MVLSGPDSKYMMQFLGEWRAVTNMFDAANNDTTNALRAAKAVLFVSKDQWVAIAVNPGDIVERFDRDPDARTWESINH